MTQDYIDRLQSACSSLTQLIAEAIRARHDDEEERLTGKREGVELALAYALEEQRQELESLAPDEPTFPAVLWRYNVRYVEDWTLATIRYQHDDGDCFIELVEGVDVNEWLAAHP